MLGIKLSSRVTCVIVAIKLAIVLLVIVVGVFYVKAGQLPPVHPAGRSPATAAAGLSAPLIQTLFGFTPITFGVGRHLRRRRDRVLRLHRVRHRRDRGRGDEEPEAGPAARHHRLAGHLHGALRRGLPGGRRHAALHRAQRRPRRWPTRSQAVGLPVAALISRRRAGRADVGRADPDARASRGAVRDEPRPPAAAAGWPRSTRGTARRTRSRSITGVVVAAARRRSCR